MNEQRLILETDGLGNLKQVPKLPPNQKLEVTIVAIADTASFDHRQRQPHPEIAGKIKILDDIFDAIPETDWELSE
jgi:hypothetical protein